MAGILANSATKSMVAGDTSASNVEDGYVTGQQVVLGTNPTGSLYSWGISFPSGSTPARSGLSSDTAAAPTFTPDVAGEYVITCTVGTSTFYVLRCSVANAAASTFIGAVRFLPLADGSVEAPSTGVTLYYSSTQSALAVKLPDDSVSTVNTTAV